MTKDLEPWQPSEIVASLGRTPDWQSLGYVVVDEVEEGIASLVISPWPQIDSRGRLHFSGEAQSIRITTLTSALEALLRQARQPVVPVALDEEQEAELRDRDIQIGDVLAAPLEKQEQGGRGDASADRPGAGTPGEPLVDPRAWLGTPVLDITATALEAAKAQASAAASGTADDRYLELIADELNEDDGG